MRLHALPLAIIALSIAACGGGDSPTSTNNSHTLTSVAITSGSATLPVGQTLQLTATPRDQSGSTMTAAVSWNSSANGIATVTSNGLVAGVAAGTVTITATASAGGATVSATKQITVTAATVTPVLTSVSIVAPSNGVTLGATLQLTANPRDQNGNAIAATVTWTTSDAAKVTVSGTGLVTGAAIGTATITAAASAGGVTASNSVQITVVAAGGSALSNVVVSPNSGSVLVGQTLQLVATPVDQNGVAMPATVTWSTSDAARASVSTTGLVTANGEGSVTITARATAGGVERAGTAVLTIVSFGLSADVTATFSNTFVPGLVEIARGGTVTWTFQTSHNVLFSGASAPGDIDITGSGSVSRMFNTAGTFNYVCSLHGGMNGVVVVH